MPTVVTAVPLVADEAGEAGDGIQIEVNHATIQGLRFTGGLDFYYKSPNQIRRTYPISRAGKNLDDLLVKQCVFVGDDQAMPLHVGVIANGHGLVLEHDVFYNVRNAVVFWGAEGGTSHRNAMRNCLVYGAGTSGIWTVETDSDDCDFNPDLVRDWGPLGPIDDDDFHGSPLCLQLESKLGLHRAEEIRRSLSLGGIRGSFAGRRWR